MSSMLGFVVAPLLFVAGIALLVVAGARSSGARGADRVQVPARLISRSWTPGGSARLAARAS